MSLLFNVQVKGPVLSLAKSEVGGQLSSASVQIVMASELKDAVDARAFQKMLWMQERLKVWLAHELRRNMVRAKVKARGLTRWIRRF